MRWPRSKVLVLAIAPMLKTQVRYFFCALAYFTRIPIPAWVGYEPDDLNHAAKYFPLVGLLVGAITAAVWYGSSLLWPARVAIVLSMIASILLTGAFHEDGLADAVDGFGGGYTRADVLRIMQDSRIGSFGGIALVVVLLLKFELLASLSPLLLPWVIIAAHGASRWVAVSYLVTLDYARPEGKAKPVATRLSRLAFVGAGLWGAIPLLWINWNMGLCALLVLLLARLLFGRYLKRRVGGYTGDALGMAQQLFELLIYLVATAWHFT